MGYKFKLWVHKSFLVIWDYKAYGVFCFVILFCFYVNVFCTLFFSILCFGPRFLLVCKWVIFWIIKSQRLSFVTFKKQVILCSIIIVPIVMGSNFVYKHHVRWLCFVLTQITNLTSILTTCWNSSNLELFVGEKLNGFFWWPTKSLLNFEVFVGEQSSKLF